MSDLISRSELKKKIEEVQYTQEFCIEHQIDYSISMQMLEMVIDNTPTVEAKTTHDVNRASDRGFIPAMKEYSRPTGKWDYTTCHSRPYRVCSNCGRERLDDGGSGWNFCPNCGADMQGGVK